jgi:Uma2 family endonuclease
MSTPSVATTQPDTLPVVTPADNLPGPPQGTWTYDDYAALPDDGQRYEIIDGVIYMTPAPNTGHQSANNLFAFYLTMHVQMKSKGRVFAAPYDVELAPDVVVQPDVIVVLQANLAIITKSRIIGAPDLLVEIASPGTAGHDRRRKQDAYARAGVREYWIADPRAQTVELLTLQQGVYHSRNVFQGGALLPSQVVPELPVKVEQFFV